VVHLKRAIEITPTDPIAHGGLGAVLSDMKRWDEAERQYRVLLKIAPRNVHGITELGNVLLRQGHIDQAIKRFQQALELSHGKWVRAMDGLGRAYREKGNLVDAEKYAKMAVDLRPVDVQSRDVLASVYLAEGHSKRAAAQYAAALRYNPDDKVAKKKLPTLVVTDDNSAAGFGDDTFEGVDLRNPNKPKKQRTIVPKTTDSSNDDNLKYFFIGFLMLVAAFVLAYYLGCCVSSNESIAGYSSVDYSDADFGDEVGERRGLYNL